MRVAAELTIDAPADAVRQIVGVGMGAQRVSNLRPLACEARLRLQASTPAPRRGSIGTSAPADLSRTRDPTAAPFGGREDPDRIGDTTSEAPEQSLDGAVCLQRVRSRR